jgi:hypothetical protein
MEPIYYQGVWRMDWGFGNPNLTAAFIAILAVGVWMLAFLHKRGFWAALVLFALLAICLVHTLSRGGLAGAACGLLPLVMFAPRPWGIVRLLAIIATLILSVAALFYFRADDRLAQGVVREDKSVTNRLIIWGRAPAMMVAAPEGWGEGCAAWAYEQWFQPLEQNERYLNLVSTHLTWLVELSWPLRGLYVAFWVAIFLLTFPSARLRWLAVPFGVWVTFFVTGIFSHVAQDWCMWILPTLFAMGALVGRVIRNEWPRKRVALVGSAGVVVILSAFVVFGMITNSSPAKGTWTRVSLGSGVPQTWVLVDRDVFGHNFGKTLRRHMEQDSSLNLGVTLKPALIPDIRNRTVLAAGAISPEDFEILKQAQKLILINTKLSPLSLSKADTLAGNLRVVFGEFSQSPTKVNWQEAGFREEIVGKGDYLGDWREILERK